DHAPDGERHRKRRPGRDDKGEQSCAEHGLVTQEIGSEREKPAERRALRFLLRRLVLDRGQVVTVAAVGTWCGELHEISPASVLSGRLYGPWPLTQRASAALFRRSLCAPETCFIGCPREIPRICKAGCHEKGHSSRLSPHQGGDDRRNRVHDL